ncbi:MAG: alpha/beta fold hydrolase [Candidatus Pacearchaeota archaeon]
MKKTDGNNFLVKWILFFVKWIFFIALGFLPSFLFISLFIQYGSPLTNYINFLSNLSESWIAWLSAAIIILLIFSIGRAIKSPKEIKKMVHNKRKLIVVAFSLLIVVGLIFWQLSLYVNFILGNDILVQLSSDKDNLFFANDSVEEVSFKISVTMNPFCVAQCEYEFLDLSYGKTIESGTLNIDSIFSKTKTYTLNKTDVASGSQNLNSFEISCKSKKTILCFTSEEENKRSVLITLNNHLTDEQQAVLDGYKEKIISLKQIFYISWKNVNESEKNLENIGSLFSVNYADENILNKLSDLKDSFVNIENLWARQEMNSLVGEIPSLENETFDFYNQTLGMKQNIFSDVYVYNNLTEKILKSKQILNNLKNGNLTEQLCTDLNNTIFNFNDAVSNFETEIYVADKEPIINNIYSLIVSLSNSAEGNLGSFSCATNEITGKSFDKIIYSPLNQSIPTITLEEPQYSCCSLGKCEICCDDTSCSQENYPVILLHGHSMNKALPADYSFDTFMEIKDNLSNDGYIDAGAFIISNTDVSGLWGRVNAPVMVTSSYYFDTYKTSVGESTTVASKTDGIDTYAIRLRNIVNSVKERTNKDKVIIIAHSMGGVVTRRYIQIFGGENVDKIILIDVPNHGISDKIKDYCSVFGSETACNDMKEDSVLINQVNNDDSHSVPVHNIVGIGCNMGVETGDGIVKNSSQYLSYATNYYVNGTCNELNLLYFHETILSPKLYPEVYEIIKKILL